jgi:predicted nucleic acid-binding protein
MRNSWLCIDANLVIRLVANPADALVRERWEQWDAGGCQLAAPTLLYYEVTNALYRYRTVGLLTASSVQLALKAALALPIRLYGETEVHQRAVRLADKFSLPAAYDAHYLALAEWLGGDLWTADKRLFQSVHAALPWVRLLS